MPVRLEQARQVADSRSRIVVFDDEQDEADVHHVELAHQVIGNRTENVPLV
jgi:hypothetical protein